MLFYSLRRKIKLEIIAWYNYFRTYTPDLKIPSKGKTIFIDPGNIMINRYFYCFVKFFQLHGYTICFPRNKKLINELSKTEGDSRFFSWLLRDGVKFGRPTGQVSIRIEREILSNRYFDAPAEENVFYLPMCEFPEIYQFKEVDGKLSFPAKRKRSVFMAGNFDKSLYFRISKSGFFDLPSRGEVIDFVKKMDFYYHLSTKEDLQRYVHGLMDNKIILIDKHNQFHVSPIKETLQFFDFYLALPGIIVPQAHNLVEALASGCIPIIHSTYAKSFKPELNHEETAFTYDNLSELEGLFHHIFNLPEAMVVEMRKNVLDFHQEYLSPSAIVTAIEQNNFDRIFIQAEAYSIISSPLG